MGMAENKRSSAVKAATAQPKKNLWRPEEDLILKNYVETHGEGNWATVSQRSGLMRSGKSCRLRWKNYLRPNIKRGDMSQEEKDLIIRMHKLLGNRWSLIAGRLPGRTDNEVKNYWNTHLNKNISCSPAGAKRKSTTHYTISKKRNKIMSPNTLTTTATSTHPIIISSTTTDHQSQKGITDIHQDEELNGSIRKEEESSTSSMTTTSLSPQCMWLGESTPTTQSFYYDIESPRVQCQYVPTNLNAAFVFDDEPFIAYMDSFLLLEAFGSCSTATNTAANMQSVSPHI